MDLDEFSHLWIVFHFHLNTSSQKNNQNQNQNQQVRRSKIAPPALGGRKVGIFATRTPHRPNPIGFTLCKIDSISNHSIYISGIDLVDGTPVLDIKPYVPHYDSVDPSLSVEKKVSIPLWVEDGLVKRRPVNFTSKSKHQLQTIMNNNNNNNNNDDDADELVSPSAIRTIDSKDDHHTIEDVPSYRIHNHIIAY